MHLNAGLVYNNLALVHTICYVTAYMSGIFSIIQIVLAVLLIAGILLQQSESSMGSAFGGGGSMGGTYHTRRGSEKFLFYATIVLGIVFALVSLTALVIGV